MRILIDTRISKHSVNLLTPHCVSLSNLLAIAGLTTFRFGASVPCVSYGQVSYANPWVQEAMSIIRPVPIMERSSPPRFCARDAWPYSEKSSKARCHLDIGLFSFPLCEKGSATVLKEVNDRFGKRFLNSIFAILFCVTRQGRWIF